MTQYHDNIMSAFLTTEDLLHTATNDLGSVLRKKVDLVCSCTDSVSIREFGGLYLVHGQYLLEPAHALRAAFVSMIDIALFPEFWSKVEELRKALPDVHVEFVNTDFRIPSLYDVLTAVDTSVLFEVILHQENYVTMLQGVCRRTTRYICVAQPCLKEDRFSLPGSASLLQFWPENLKDEFRQHSFWPKEPRTDRFEKSHWMWGHTTSHLISVMGGLGWGCDYGEVISDVYGPNWDYSLLRFRPT
jgi:hypothetical protein